jgi:hypothetical protein
MGRDQIEDSILQAHYKKDEGRRIDKNSADNLMELLRSEMFLRVIHSPFYFSTALEVFSETILDKNPLPENETALKAYLVEKFIHKKLSITPNPRNYAPAKTRKWLKKVAQLMTKNGLLTFELSDLQPSALSSRCLLPSLQFIRLGAHWFPGRAGFLFLPAKIAALIGAPPKVIND